MASPRHSGRASLRRERSGSNQVKEDRRDSAAYHVEQYPQHGSMDEIHAVADLAHELWKARQKEPAEGLEFDAQHHEQNGSGCGEPIEFHPAGVSYLEHIFQKEL